MSPLATNYDYVADDGFVILQHDGLPLKFYCATRRRGGGAVDKAGTWALTLLVCLACKICRSSSPFFLKLKPRDDIFFGLILSTARQAGVKRGRTEDQSDSMRETRACMRREAHAGRWACEERCRQERAMNRWTRGLYGRTDVLWLRDGRRRQGPAIWLRSALAWSDTVLDDVRYAQSAAGPKVRSDNATAEALTTLTVPQPSTAQTRVSSLSLATCADALTRRLRF
ncbi:hypothetical protein EV421DRAFT_1737926 [Armillaria borealis]|uniref:Uncharacterized protein n=1 Tax=Armillaria borealis TaxID=47425 RepID=A0AA39MMJ0_9AGAR|nr:hypothetical protein EV421DRAFT_1737926 [Armillaria borealis]